MWCWGGQTIVEAKPALDTLPLCPASHKQTEFDPAIQSARCRRHHLPQDGHQDEKHRGIPLLERTQRRMMLVDDGPLFRAAMAWARSLAIRWWLGLALLAFALLSFFLMNFSVDDSYIYLRYARNLKEHGLWNWNPVAPVVEAYTGALYAFLPIIPIYADMPPQLFFDVIGLASLFALAARVGRDALDPFMRAFLLLLLLLSPTTYIHVYSGLETPVFMLLVYEAFRSYRRAATQQGSHRYFYVVCLLLAFVRSDGPLLAAVLFGALSIQSRFKVPDLKWFLGVLLVGGLYFAWRYQYFQNLLPAPAYQKLGNGQGMFKMNWRSARLYVLPLLVLFPWWVMVRNRSAIVVSVAALAVCGMYLTGQLEMNFSDRFFYQVCLPALLFLGTQIEFKRIAVKNLATLALVLFLAGVIARGLNNDYVRTYTYSLYNSYRVMGDALGKFSGKGYSLLAGDCGMLPYRSGWYVYDYMGLANMHVARKGLTAEYLRSVSPDVLIVYLRRDGEPEAKDVVMAADRTKLILSYANESGAYRYVDSFTSGNYYNAMYVKRGLSDEVALTAEIHQASHYTKDFFRGEDRFSYRRIVDFILAGKWLSL
jgi:arabinofuranosyltransferase